MMFEARNSSTRRHRGTATLAPAFSAFALLVALVGFADAANANPYYLRSTVGPPWGVNVNELAMNDVFGAGNWVDARYETVDPATLFSNSDFIFMEGGDSNANEMEAFLIANAAAINTFVNGGGVIFFNAAPNEGDGMNYGFGVSLSYMPGPFCGGDCIVVDGAHSIVNGPFLPVGTIFGGDWFSHAIVVGSFTSLIEDSSGNTLLAELAVGSGFAIFGSMTTSNFHSPQPNADNLLRNIIAYGDAISAGATPTPTPISTPTATPTATPEESPNATPTPSPTPPPPGAQPYGLVWLYHSAAGDGTPGCGAEPPPCGVTGSTQDEINLWIDGGSMGSSDEGVCTLGEGGGSGDELCGADILIEMTNGHFKGIEPLSETLVCNPSCACSEGVCYLEADDITTIRMNFRRGSLLPSPDRRPVAKLIFDSSGNSSTSPTKVVANGVWAVGANLQARPVANTLSACTAPGEPFVCCTGANTGDSRWPCGPRTIVPTRLLPEPGQLWQLLSGLAGLGCLYRLRRRT